ncbi:DUF6046 domain-containing protein [Pedobacter sp. MW01-1-1]|uniref:DUF6046 domain-containing protein n=1 Tax=Pedobacter sp. MW01-1-1 TaxID=3383027 RepID=UPI003FEFD2A3
MSKFNSFNLADLYQKAFGVKGVRFAITTPEKEQAAIHYSSLNVPDVLQAPVQSVLGTPIYELITLKDGDLEYTFPDWPLIDVAFSKNIIKTPLKGYNGTVKEFINIDDYQIQIRGILINYVNDEYPLDLLDKLKRICSINKELQVTSPVLNQLDIHNLVITDVRYPEVEGYNHIQPFVIQALSDEPIELIIQAAQILKGL